MVLGLCLAVATIVLFLALWIVAPPPTYPALILAVGSPEAAAWLIAVSVVIALVVGRAVGRSWLARLTMLAAVAAIALAAIPLVQFPATARRFDAAMRAALGAEYLCGVPADVLDSMRPRVLNPLELFTGLEAGHARITRGVRFAVNDGVPLTLDIYRPERAGSYASVVQVYGGAWQRGAPGNDSVYAAYLASHGYVVFAIDYRHAPRWPWPAQLADVRAALRWIERHGRQYGADPDRLALIGRSSGAQLAMVGAYGPGGPPIRAVVSYYGPVDLVEGYRHPPAPDPLHVRDIEEAFLGGTPDDVPELYREASPVTYATHRLPPTLLVYAARDHVVEARFGALLDERLRATGNTSVLLDIPWSEHGFDAVTGGPGAQLALYYTERFLAWSLRSSDSTACARSRSALHHLQ